MNVSSVIIFIVGIILTIFGASIMMNNLHDIWSLIVGVVMLCIGVGLLSGRGLSL